MTHPSDALPMPKPLLGMFNDGVYPAYNADQFTAARREAWDAAAALAMRLDQEHGFTPQPSAQTLKDADGRCASWLRDLIEGLSISVDVSTNEETAGNRYFGTVTEVMDAPGDKLGVTLLVQDAKPNFGDEK